MPTIGTRLAEFGKSKFGDTWGWQTRFAESLGISSSSMRQYLSGARKPGNEMQSRLRSLGCQIEWLMTGKGSMHDPEERGFVRMVRETINEPGGEMKSASEISTYTYFPLSIAKPEEIRAIAVPDDSMAGVVWNGDTVFVRRDQGFAAGDLCLVKTASGHKLRHLYVNSENALLTATNAAPESIPVSELLSVHSVVAATIEGVRLKGK